MAKTDALPRPSDPGARDDATITAWQRRAQEREHRPGIALADASARYQALDGQNPYDGVLAKVKEELQLTRILPPDAYANPQPDHFRIVLDVALRAVHAHNGGAASRGHPVLSDSVDDGEVDADDALRAGAERVARRMVDDVLGWGMLQSFMSDADVEEIFINGAGSVFVQRAGRKPEPVGAGFRSAQALVTFINNKLDVGAAARTVTLKTPYRDYRLRDGSRIHVIMDPLVSNLGAGGMAVTIRRFRSIARDLDDLVRLRMLPAPAANLLRACVAAKMNICVSGGTGTGKTTFLTALTSAIDRDDRTITVEDTAELALGHLPNWVQLVTREKGEGVEPITMEQLVRHCLRMRPRRILLGEARGPEMVAILEAMNTGHDGCMFTVHADDAHKSLLRIETLYLKAGMGNVPLLAVRREIATAVQIVVNIGMFLQPDGSEVRRVREIAYVTGVVEGDAVQQEKLFRWEAPRGQPPHAGRLTPTGARPSALVQRLEAAGGFSWDRDIVGSAGNGTGNGGRA
jgi:pilus assembly protein CpaF